VPRNSSKFSRVLLSTELFSAVRKLNSAYCKLIKKRDVRYAALQNSNIMNKKFRASRKRSPCRRATVFPKCSFRQNKMRGSKKLAEVLPEAAAPVGERRVM
jgi:hypothetical protein